MELEIIFPVKAHPVMINFLHKYPEKVQRAGRQNANDPPHTHTLLLDSDSVMRTSLFLASSNEEVNVYSEYQSGHFFPLQTDSIFAHSFWLNHRTSTRHITPSLISPSVWWQFLISVFWKLALLHHLITVPLQVTPSPGLNATHFALFKALHNKAITRCLKTTHPDGHVPLQNTHQQSAGRGSVVTLSG